MKGVHFFKPSLIAQNENFVRYENGYDESFLFVIDIIP